MLLLFVPKIFTIADEQKQYSTRISALRKAILILILQLISTFSFSNLDNGILAWTKIPQDEITAQVNDKLIQGHINQ